MTTDSQAGLAAAPCYAVERICNGYVFTDTDGNKRFVKDVEELGKWFTANLSEEVERMRHHEWDGKFTVIFGFKK